MNDTEIDEKGFEKLLQTGFINYRNILFLDNRFDRNEIESLLGSYSQEEVQRLKNHQEMHFYAGFNKSKQEEFGERLKENWERKLLDLFPDIPAWVEVKKDDDDVVVTVVNGKGQRRTKTKAERVGP